MFRNKTLEEMKILIDLYVDKVIVMEDEIQVVLILVSSIYSLDFPRKISTISRDVLKKSKFKRKRLQFTDSDSK